MSRSPKQLRNRWRTPEGSQKAADLSALLSSGAPRDQIETALGVIEFSDEIGWTEPRRRRSRLPGKSGPPVIPTACTPSRGPQPRIGGSLLVLASIINSVAPPEIEAMWLQMFRDAGLLDRVMFGSDNKPLAATIARSRDVPFLSDAERRGLLCGNAARFLQLDDAVCKN